MKKRIIIMILIFIQIIMTVISTVQADDDEYYIIEYYAQERRDEPIKIKKTAISNTKNKDKIYELRDQLYNIDIDALSANGLYELDKLIGDFYNGAYQNLKEELNSTYNKIWNQDTPTSVAARIIKAAENPILRIGRDNPDVDKLDALIRRRKEGKNKDDTYIEPPKSSAVGSGSSTPGSKTEEQKEKEEAEKTTIYQLPKKQASTDSGESIDDLISDADSFIAQGTEMKYDDTALQNFSTIMFNGLLTVAVAIALIVGIIIGIKYMMGSVEEKANYKQMLLPYVVGCVVVFGAFGIWKLMVTILESV